MYAQVHGGERSYRRVARVDGMLPGIARSFGVAVFL
jgi:hypothetical protein